MQWRQVAGVRQILNSETGALVRDWGGQLPIVLGYPNRYAVGMSSLAVHGLYRWLNAMRGVVCERTFASWGAGIPAQGDLITLESQRPVRDAAVLALSVSYEMDYLNIVSMLRSAGIPVRGDERDEGDPLVILGGPAVSANPEPVAAVADAVVVGEAEPLLGDLVDCLRGRWHQARPDTLAALSRLPGVYVPLSHDGQTVQRQWLADLDRYPLASCIVAPRAEFGDMHLIELSRGCGRGCRFCLAGYWYRPPRERSLGVILDQAREGLARLPKVGLVAAAVSDYSAIDELVARLREMGAAISVSSLRVQPLSPTLVEALAESGSRSITIAPEAGSEKLRRIINKCVSHADIVAAVALAARHRFEMVKLYFMLGLPDEQDSDIDALILLVREVSEIFPRNVVVTLTPFVPKAHTPFERLAMAPAAVLEERLSRIRGALHGGRIQVRGESVEESRIQGILARGDRRVGEILAALSRPSAKRFVRALEENGLDVDSYLGASERTRILPWHWIESGVSPAYLQEERGQGASGLPTVPCVPLRCSRCGVCAEAAPGGERA